MIIPLLIRRSEPIAKFKLPFRLQNEMETEFEFIFIKSSKPKNCTEVEER